MVHNRTIIRLLVLSRHAEVMASPRTYLSDHSLVWNSRTSVTVIFARFCRKQVRIKQTIHIKVIQSADFCSPIPQLRRSPGLGRHLLCVAKACGPAIFVREGRADIRESNESSFGASCY